MTTQNIDKTKRYHDFFQSLIAKLQYELPKGRNHPRSSFVFPSDTSRVSYCAVFGRKQARVEVWFNDNERGPNIQRFEYLERYKAEIESGIGQTLDWQRLENRKRCRIALHHPGSIEDDAETLEEIQDWMVEYLLKFKQAFGPRLAELIE